TVFVRKHRTRDSHLVKISIPGKLKQRGNLVFPTKLSHRRLSSGEIRYVIGPPRDFRRKSFLQLSDGDKSLIRHSIHQTQTEQRRGPTQSYLCCLRRHRFTDDVARGARLSSNPFRLNQRATKLRQRIKISVGDSSETRFRDFAVTARHRI